MVTLSGSQPQGDGALTQSRTALGNQPATIVVNILDSTWDTDNVAKPVLTDREDARLWQDIPSAGLVVTYLETGGLRRTMLTNWHYFAELANVTVEVKTLQSNDRLLSMLDEVERIVENKLSQFDPYGVTRVLSRVQSTRETHGSLFGVIRLELRRDGARTASTTRSTFADDDTQLETTFKNAVQANWDSNAAAAPQFVIREATAELWVDVPRSGALIFYGDASGVRRTMLGNWQYRLDIATLVCEVNTPRSRGHLFALQEEVQRIVESLSHGFGRYSSAKVVSRNIKYGQTQDFWRGDMRIEVSQHVRTGYTVP